MRGVSVSQNRTTRVLFAHQRSPIVSMSRTSTNQISAPLVPIAPSSAIRAGNVSRSVRSASSAASAPVSASSCLVAPGETVLVFGATGGVGQILTAKLIERGYKVKAVIRSREKARQVLGTAPGLELVEADHRNAASLTEALFRDVSAVLCCTGTTAFPSARWKGGNDPRATDWEGMMKLVSAAKTKPNAPLKRFLFVTSAGVNRFNKPPYSILNLFNVLRYKKAAEEYLQDSKIPYTIIRPGRLTDGPYTSYDLNTLLKATSGTRRDVVLAREDRLDGQASRIAVAEALVQALLIEDTVNRAFSLESSEGDGPGTDAAMWKKLYVNAN